MLAAYNAGEFVVDIWRKNKFRDPLLWTEFIPFSETRKYVKSVLRHYLIYKKIYQQNRILTFINPEKDPLGAAYQIIQSKTAIGSGGLFGKGWGEGTQTHLKFLPVQESDFILSVMGEELGFVTVSLVLVVFGYLIAQVMKQSYFSKDRFSSLALIGFAAIFMAHVFVNTAMTVGLIPVKGLPFPFISAGGSFLITSYMMIGLILKLSVNYTD